MPLLRKGIFKKDLGAFSVCLVSMILCNPSLKLGKSLIMSGMCLGRLCSRSRLFAKSISMPCFLCSKLKVRFKSSRTSPGLLWLLTMFFSFCSISVRVVVCCLLRLCDIFLNFLWFLLKSEITTMFSVPFLEILPTFLTLSFCPYG